MRLRTLLALSSVGPLALGACTSDLPAPNNYPPPLDDSDDASASDTAGDVQLSCEDIPGTAVDAMFAYTPMASGGDGFYSWGASDLPDGLAIHAMTGAITGTPTTEGSFTFEVTVTDTSGATASATCQLEVNPRLEVDLPLETTQPYCLRNQQALPDFVVPGTGDGTPITCEPAGGRGGGKVPAGISVNPDTCRIEGTLEETRYGTWVFIVRGIQSGAEVYMPYCVTQPDQAPGAYTIEMQDSTITDPNVSPAAAALIPIVRTFDPSAALDFGGMMDPLFTITSPGSCGSTCYYGYAYSINASGFDPQTFSVGTAALLEDANGQGIGFTHELAAGGPPVDEALRDRPWVLNVSMDYCLSTVQADCENAEATRANGNGNLEVGIVMVPE